MIPGITIPKYGDFIRSLLPLKLSLCQKSCDQLTGKSHHLSFSGLLGVPPVSINPSRSLRFQSVLKLSASSESEELIQIVPLSPTNRHVLSHSIETRHISVYREESIFDFIYVDHSDDCSEEEDGEDCDVRVGKREIPSEMNSESWITVDMRLLFECMVEECGEQNGNQKAEK